MSTVVYVVRGLPSAFAECHHWVNRVTFGLWDGMLSALCLPGSSVHRACAALRSEILVD